MQFDFIDNYLLEGRPGKAETIREILAKRAAAPAAAPFYRALEALGVRAADETLVALRLILAGKAPTDESVQRLRDAARQRASAEYKRQLE